MQSPSKLKLPTALIKIDDKPPLKPAYSLTNVHNDKKNKEFVKKINAEKKERQRKREAALK